jgi:hypothetical protein
MQRLEQTRITAQEPRQGHGTFLISTVHDPIPKVHRPWGWYDSVDGGARFQVKRIVIHLGTTLSVQMHHHDAEC